MATGKGLLQRMGKALMGGDRALSKLIKQAHQALDEGHLDLAKSLLDQGHATLTGKQASVSLAKAYQQLALAFEDADQDKAAVPYWMKAVDQLDKGDDPQVQAQYVHVALEAARRLLIVHDIALAEKLLRKAAKYAEPMNMIAEQAEIAFLRGICAIDMKQPDEAAPWFRMVFQLANNDAVRVPCKETVLRSTGKLLSYYRKKGDEANEAKLIEDLIALYVPLGDRLLVLNDLSATATQSGLHDLGLILGHRFAHEAEAAHFNNPELPQIEFHYAASKVGLAQNYYRHQRDDATAIHHGQVGLEKARAVANGPFASEYGGIYTAALQALALPLLRAGHYTEGRPLLRELHEQIAEQMGKESPEYAKFLWDESDLYREIDPSFALSLNQEAVTRYEAILGPQHHQLAFPLHTLSDRYLVWGDYLAAEETIQRAIAIVNETFGEEHPSLIEQGLLGKHRYVLMAQKRYAEAESLAHRELALTQEHFPLDAVVLGQAYTALSSAFYHQKQYAEAAEPLRMFEALYERTFGKRSAQYVSVLIREGVRLFASGEAAKAWERFAAAEALTKEFPDEPNQMAFLAFFQAQTQQRLGSTIKANHFDKKAQSILKDAYPPDKLPAKYLTEVLELVECADLAGILHSTDRWLERAEQISPNTPFALQVKLLEWRYYRLTALGQQEEAAQLLEQAVSLIMTADPPEPLALAHLWERLASREIYAKHPVPAQKAGERALQVRQRHAPSTVHLTKALLQRIAQMKGN